VPSAVCCFRAFRVFVVAIVMILPSIILPASSAWFVVR
jgi:hypothetical protein